MKQLKNKKIAIVGLGGLGGYIANLVSRLNPAEILLIDGDNFSQSNFNRQLFCTEQNLGKNKALCTKEFLYDATTSKLIVEENFLTDKNIDLLYDMDIIMDATDNIKTRFLMQDYCSKNNIPIMHGAINGFYGQVALIRPKSKLFDNIYPNKNELPIKQTLSFVPSIIASFQVSEMVKYFTENNPLKENDLLIIDTINNDLRVLNL